MKNEAVFAGTFDPITKGHVDIIKKALLIFDKVHILVAINPEKRCMFDESSRVEMVKDAMSDENLLSSTETCAWHGYLYEYCLEKGIRVIVKGVRNSADFEYEKMLAEKTNELCKDVETILLISASEHEDISSTTVRQLIVGGKDIADFVPKSVIRYIEEVF